MDAIDHNEKIMSDKIDALQLEMPMQRIQPTAPPAKDKEGIEEVVKMREQIYNLHGQIKIEKDERVEMFSNIERKPGLTPKIQEIIYEIIKRMDIIEERHDVDMKTLMKTLEEKLKVKVKLEEQPAKPEMTPTLKEVYAQVVGLKKEIEHNKTRTVDKKYEPEKAKQEETKKDTKSSTEVVIPPNKEAAKLALAMNKDINDKVELLDHTLKIGLNSISGKADKAQLETMQSTVNTLKTEFSKMQVAFKLLDDYKKSSEQSLVSATGEINELKEAVAIIEKKAKRAEEISTVLEFKSKEHDEAIAKKADLLDLKLLKDLILQSNNTIDRLCKILENVNLDEPLVDENIKGVNLKVLYFKMHQKMEALEKDIERLNSELARSTEEETKEPHKIPVVHEHPEGRVSKYEGILNDLRAELDDLKSNSLKFHESSITDLRRSIDSLGGDMKKLYEDLVNQIQDKMRFVINRDMLDSYQESLRSSLDKMDKKLERVEMNKQTFYLRKKIQALEDKIALKKPKEPGEEIPMMMCNYKCFFCSRDVNITPANVSTVNNKMSKRYSFKSFNPPATTLYGPGFSRILEAIRTHPELESELFNKTAQQPQSIAVETLISPKIIKSAFSKKNSKLSPLSFKN